MANYTFQTVSYPSAYETELTGINNAGEVAGSYAPVAAATAAQNAFTEQGGTFTNIVLPNTRPRDYTGGINNGGKVALTAGGGTTKPEGVLWSPDGSFITIDPTNEAVHAYGVNDAGTVVGSIRSYFGSGPMSAFVDSNGALSTFQVDGLDTEAHGINNAGDIVGQTIGTASSSGSGFIDRGGVITHISGDPAAINNLGTVAGSIYDGTHWHGFIDDTQGHMAFIDAPGAVDTFVTGINDNGDLSGYYDTQSFGATQGFIATPPPDPPALSVFDTTTQAQVAAAGTPYSGPVAGLQNQYISAGSDSLNITATTPGWFIHAGSGTDAISVSSGTNVLDGGTGSNFLTGGNGTDTFFVDDRSASSDIWSTVVGFHQGDAATIWGVTPQDFNLAWVDGQGASGYTGLTLHATKPSAPTASLTLAGYSQADIASGRITVQFGTDTASGSSYMYIHA